MQKMIFYSLIITVHLSCSSMDKKIFIQSNQVDSLTRCDWYFFSELSNFSRSYIQLAKSDSTDILFESFYITDFSCMSDSLSVQLFKNDFKIDSSKLALHGLKIKIDTTGGIWNQASSRLGRLQKKQVDYFKPHFADSYCPQN